MRVTEAEARRLGVVPPGRKSLAQRILGRLKRQRLERRFDAELSAATRAVEHDRQAERGLLWIFETMEREYRFHPARGWRFDRAWPELMVAVEIEGGTWAAGRHVRGAGFANDCDKLNAAAIAGWAVLRLTADQLTHGAHDVIHLLEERRAARDVREGMMTVDAARERYGDGR